MEQLRIIVTGGGTSGHISPALATISALRAAAAAQNQNIEFLYIGGKRGLEREIVSAQNIPFVGIETGKLRRYFSVENFIDQLRLPVGFFQSLRAIRKFHPHVLFSTGGYVAVPPVLAAKVLRVPILIHEQTVQIGLANRITSRFADKIALSFDSARSELSQALQARSVVTGNPIRPAIFGGDKNQAIELCSFSHEDDGLRTVYVTGGSQGARILNRAVEEILPELLQTCRVIHQCGRQPAGEEQDLDRLQKAREELSPELQRRYFVTRFLGDEINHVFALADLVVGRAGAGTVAELCALGKPAIYVPLVPTGGDEQTRNAKMCEERDAARIIKQSELNGQTLLDAVKVLLLSTQTLEQMSSAAQTLAKPDAAQELAAIVMELAHSSRPRR
jgi:UDP-N-acetylglucosamine--N-acetylmuramyl-(pentapeptide) pyrophosphoryl-undecaprenol N-acetylglucosamine transferase